MSDQVAVRHGDMGLESCQSQPMIRYKPVILCMFVIIYLVKSQIPSKGSDYQLYMPQALAHTHTHTDNFCETENDIEQKKEPSVISTSYNNKTSKKEEKAKIV